MKKLIPVLFVAFFLLILSACSLLNPPLVEAGMTDLTLEWDAITDPIVVQVEIYQRDYPNGSYDYTKPVKVVFTPNTEAVILNIPNGTYAWIARAVDEDGLDSPNSNEVTDTFAVPPGAVKNLKKKLAIPSL